MSIEFEFDVADDSNPNFIKVLAKNNGVDIMDFREVGPGGGNGQYRALCGDPRDGQEFLSQLYDMTWEEVLDNYGDFGLLGSSAETPVEEAADSFEAPGKKHLDINDWMDEVWALAQQRYNVPAQHLNLLDAKIAEAFEYDYSPEEVVEAFFGQKDDMEEAHKFTPGKQSSDKKDREEAARSKTKPGKAKWSRADDKVKEKEVDEGPALAALNARSNTPDQNYDPEDAFWQSGPEFQGVAGMFGYKPDGVKGWDAGDKLAKRNANWKKIRNAETELEFPNEGYKMKLKEFFIHEAIWTGDGGRKRGKEDPDTWRDRRKDSKFDGSAPERDDREGRWDKIDRDAQKDEAVGADTDEPKYGDYPPAFDGGGNDAGHEDPASVCPECQGNGFSVQGPDGQWEECSTCTDPATGRTLPPEQWKPSKTAVPKNNEEGWEEPDAAAGKAEWMMGEAHGENAQKKGDHKHKDVGHVPMYQSPHGTKNKPDDAPPIDDPGDGFGEDPDEDMFFGDKQADDYVGRIDDPTSSKVPEPSFDNFDDDPIGDVGFGDIDPGDAPGRWNDRGWPTSQGDDAVTFPEYEGDPNYRRSSRYDSKQGRYVDDAPDEQGFYPRAPEKKSKRK
jgi:hypothetical protein